MLVCPYYHEVAAQVYLYGGSWNQSTRCLDDVCRIWSDDLFALSLCFLTYALQNMRISLNLLDEELGLGILLMF